MERRCRCRPAGAITHVHVRARVLASMPLGCTTGAQVQRRLTCSPWAPASPAAWGTASPGRDCRLASAAARASALATASGDPLHTLNLPHHSRARTGRLEGLPGSRGKFASKRHVGQARIVALCCMNKPPKAFYQNRQLTPRENSCAWCSAAHAVRGGGRDIARAKLGNSGSGWQKRLADGVSGEDNACSPERNARTLRANRRGAAAAAAVRASPEGRAAQAAVAGCRA